ncbi:hypothetical protein NM208_g1646 [Fusarium decemcellulare]|uniref:Uncharacterized protein n=2 Tax=Fusarium decemcellulare TaxID=57161 RepID=A0ACC1SV87_9HYPO|nr:hypothetical protein NM208_g2091 [Fusarium decemcellulare]KAJ3547186.1 hypothetical protein NM208_g1646 [Fusarium decemcellulare]
MTCDVGETNPDIAGLGILISFATQAGLSIILSCISLVLWKNLATSLLVKRNTNPLYSPYEDIKQLSIYAEALMGVVRSRQDVEAQYESAKDARRTLKRRISMCDLQIFNALALLLAALIQWRSLSLYHLHIVYDTASFTMISACASFICMPLHDVRLSQKLFLAAYFCIFMSFTAVFSLRLGQWDINKPGHCYVIPVGPRSSFDLLFDEIYILITAQYSAITIILGYRSSQTLPSELHQKLEQPMTSSIVKAAKLLRLEKFLSGLDAFKQRFLSIMKFMARITDVSNLSRRQRLVRYILIAALILLFLTPVLAGFLALWYLNVIFVRGKQEDIASYIAIVSLVQGTIHLGVAIALRIRNKKELHGDSESTWGFGQIISLLLLAGTLTECIRGISDYRKAEKLKKNEEQEGNNE